MKKSISFKMLLSLAMLLSATSLFSATWYVSKGGSDANPGTSASPFASITNALQNAGMNDLIQVSAGIYTQSVLFKKNKSKITIKGGFTPGTWGWNPGSQTTIIRGRGDSPISFSTNTSTNTLSYLTLTGGTNRTGLIAGGIKFLAASNRGLLVESCVITSNAYGVYDNNFNVIMTIKNSIITKNKVHGLYLISSANVGGGTCYLYNCTVANNNGHGYYTSSGNAAWPAFNPVAVNTLFTYNNGYGIYKNLGSGIATSENCLYFSNAIASYIKVTELGNSKSGQDPLFINKEANNYNIASNSPAAASGKDLTAFGVLTDIVNTSRPGPYGWDMGAYQVNGPGYISLANTYVSISGNDTIGDGSMGNPFATISHGIGSTAPWGTVHVAAGMYNEKLQLGMGMKGITIKGGYNSGSWLWNPLVNQTVVNGNTNSPLTFFVGAESNTLSSLILTGGKNNPAIKIVDSPKSLMIDGCIITSNKYGFYCANIYAGKLIVKNSIISRNTSHGIFFTNSSSINAGTNFIMNSTFVNNGGDGFHSSTSVGSYKGQAVHAINSLFTGNGGYSLYKINPGASSIQNCFFSNTMAGYYTANVVFSDYGCNISNQSPQYVDPANKNYQLQIGSPALVTGTNWLKAAGVTLSSLGVTADFLGVARPGLYGWDMGAYQITDCDLSGPFAPALVVPGNSKKTNTGNINFVWNKTSDRGPAGVVNYRLLISSNSFAGTQRNYLTGSGNITNFIPGFPLSDGSWEWKVYAQDNSGNSGDISLIQACIVDTSVPSSPMLELPLHSAILRTNSPQLSWLTAYDAGTGVSNYNVFLDTNSPVTVIATNFSTAGLSQGAHAWKIQAIDRVGNMSGFASTNNFVIDTIAPSVVLLQGPVSNSVFPALNVTLNWSSASDASTSVAGYIVQTAQNSAFTGLMEKITNSTSLSVTFMNGSTNWWRVKAFDIAGNTNNTWSSEWIIMIDTNQIIPVLLAPTNSTLTKVTTPLFTWSDESLNGATKYWIEIRSTNMSGTLIQSISNLTVPSNRAAPLADGRYEWAVKAYKSSTFSWQVISGSKVLYIDATPPGSPTISSPVNGFITPNTTPRLEWNPLADLHGIAGYDVTVNGVTNFVNSTNWVIAPALTDGTYYWQVRAIDLAGNKGAFSTAQSIIIYTTVPIGGFNLSSPAGITNNSWNTKYTHVSNVMVSLSGADHYIVTVITNGIAVKSTNMSISGMIPLFKEGTNHVVLIKSNNNGCISISSNKIYLQTANPSPAKSILVNNGIGTTEIRNIPVVVEFTNSGNILSNAGYYIGEACPTIGSALWIIGTMPVIESNIITLSAALGMKTVSVWIIDQAGNVSAAMSSQVVYAVPQTAEAVPENSFVFSPNPLNIKNGETGVVTYNAKAGTSVQLEFYTLTGILIRTLKDENGDSKMEWKGDNASGQSVATGMYLVIMKINGKAANKVPKKIGVINH